MTRIRMIFISVADDGTVAVDNGDQLVICLYIY